MLLRADALLLCAAMTAVTRPTPASSFDIQPFTAELLEETSEMVFKSFFSTMHPLGVRSFDDVTAVRGTLAPVAAAENTSRFFAIVAQTVLSAAPSSDCDCSATAAASASKRARGNIIGFGLLHKSAASDDERIGGVGPVAVAVDCQVQGIGKALMHALMTEARRLNYTSLRLGQVAAVTRSFALYVSLGFDFKDLITVLVGWPRVEVTVAAPSLARELEIRAMRLEDVDACVRLCRDVMGFGRRNDLLLTLEHSATGPFALVAFRRAKRDPAAAAADADGDAKAATGDASELVGYSQGFWRPGHTVARSEGVTKCLFLHFCKQFAAAPTEASVTAAASSASTDSKIEAAGAVASPPAQKREPRLTVLGRLNPELLRW